MKAPAEPLEVERLATDDERRLEVATRASQPLPASVIEELLADLRRIESTLAENRKLRRA